MPTYIVRLELHGVPQNQSGKVYDNLRTKMEADDYFKEIEIDGQGYELPSGVYVKTTTTNRSALSIDTAAYIIAGKVWTKGCSLFTAKIEEPEDFYSQDLRKL